MPSDAPSPQDMVRWLNKLDLDRSQPKAGAGKKAQARLPRIKSTLPNVRAILKNDARLAGRIGFNELAQCVVFMAEPTPVNWSKSFQFDAPHWIMNNSEDRQNGRRWTDAHTNDLRTLLEMPGPWGPPYGYGLRVSDRDIQAAIDAVARENTFHPVRDYLSGLTWQGYGVARGEVETLFIDYLGCPDDDYHREAALLFMIGAVVRVFEPGHKFDYVPILEGMQGAGKSTFINTLGGAWFGEMTPDFHDNQRVMESLRGKWILELPELNGFSRADVTTLKAAVTRTHDRGRAAYARNVEEIPRSCVFMGSTNEDDYLRDATGGRRFWPIACQKDDGEIDIGALRGEVDQLWAEAVHIYRDLRRKTPNGPLPLYMMNERAERIAKELQETRRADLPEDILAGEIAAVLDGLREDDLDDSPDAPLRNSVCIKEVWCDLLGRDPKALEARGTPHMVGKALRRAGWSPGAASRCAKYGVQKRFYRRPA